MIDETEEYRRDRQAELNAREESRRVLEFRYGTVYNTTELQQRFRVVGFAAPYVIVERKSDGILGSLEFQHEPRFFFNFREKD